MSTHVQIMVFFTFLIHLSTSSKANFESKVKYSTMDCPKIDAMKKVSLVKCQFDKLLLTIEIKIESFPPFPVLLDTGAHTTWFISKETKAVLTDEYQGIENQIVDLADFHGPSPSLEFEEEGEKAEIELPYGPITVFSDRLFTKNLQLVSDGEVLEHFNNVKISLASCIQIKSYRAWKDGLPMGNIGLIFDNSVDTNFLSQIYSQLDKPMFAVKLDQTEQIGEFALGKSISQYDTLPWISVLTVPAMELTNTWAFRASRVTVCFDEKLTYVFLNETIIVDTGASMIELNDEKISQGALVIDPIPSNLQLFLEKVCPCVKNCNEDKPIKPETPKIVIEIDAENKMEITKEVLRDYNPQNPENWYPKIRRTGPGYMWLGLPFFQQFYTEFNFEAMTMTFSKVE